MSRGIDLLITYRVIKMLVTPFEKTDAYKYGIIDKNGKVLRKNKTLTVAKEKDSYTILHRFVFNLKRLINLIPGGKSKLGTYAAALGLLLKEEKESINEELKRGFMVHSDPDATERDWKLQFKELSKGHPHPIDYGPRESDMYDWNDRSLYDNVTKEFHSHMEKIGKQK